MLAVHHACQQERRCGYRQYVTHLVHDVPLQELVVPRQLVVPPKVSVQQLLHPLRVSTLSLTLTTLLNPLIAAACCCCCCCCRPLLSRPLLQHAGTKAVCRCALCPLHVFFKGRQESLLQLLLLLHIGAGLLAGRRRRFFLLLLGLHYPLHGLFVNHILQIHGLLLLLLGCSSAACSKQSRQGRRPGE
jgi:hypothetical protein